MLILIVSCTRERVKEAGDILWEKTKKELISRDDCNCSLDIIPDSSYTIIGVRKDLSSFFEKGGLSWEKIQKGQQTKFFIELSGEKDIVDQTKYFWVDNSKGTNKEIKLLRNSCCAKERLYCKTLNDTEYRDSTLKIFEFYYKEASRIMNSKKIVNVDNSTTLKQPEEANEVNPCNAVANFEQKKDGFYFDYYCPEYSPKATLKLAFFTVKSSTPTFVTLPYQLDIGQKFQCIFQRDIPNLSYDWQKVEISINNPGGKEQLIGIFEKVNFF